MWGLPGARRARGARRAARGARRAAHALLCEFPRGAERRKYDFVENEPGFLRRTLLN